MLGATKLKPAKVGNDVYLPLLLPFTCSRVHIHVTICVDTFMLLSVALLQNHTQVAPVVHPHCIAFLAFA